MHSQRKKDHDVYRLKLIKSLDARKGMVAVVEETEIHVQLRIVSWKCTRCSEEKSNEKNDACKVALNVN